jgi:hypothetical protein
MFQVHSIRIATVAALGALLILSGMAPAGQELKEAAAAALEVRVLEAQVPAGEGERSDVLYRMEVISVLRSASPVEPGDTITVRSYALSQEALDRGVVGPQVLAPGWLGVAYLNPDPEAGGPDAGRRFTIAAEGDSFEDIPPGPPSLRWTEEVEVGAE